MDLFYLLAPALPPTLSHCHIYLLSTRLPRTGLIELKVGASKGGSPGGNLKLDAGNTTGMGQVGGRVDITAGTGSHINAGSGGEVKISAGAAGGRPNWEGNGGDIRLTGGSANGGFGGHMFMQSGYSEKASSGSIGELLCSFSDEFDLLIVIFLSLSLRMYSSSQSSPLPMQANEVSVDPLIWPLAHLRLGTRVPSSFPPGTPSWGTHSMERKRPEAEVVFILALGLATMAMEAMSR